MDYNFYNDTTVCYLKGHNGTVNMGYDDSIILLINENWQISPFI